MIFYYNSNCPYSIFLIYVILWLSVSFVLLGLNDILGYLFIYLFIITNSKNFLVFSSNEYFGLLFFI